MSGSPHRFPSAPTRFEVLVENLHSRIASRRSGGPARIHRASARVLMLGFVLLGSGCAKREPPSGGPPDLEPPRRTASTPDSGSAGVPLDAVISVTFSEGMEPRATAEAVSIAPMIEIRKRQWRGRTLTLVPARPLEPNRTYTLFVAGSSRDRHGNTMSVGSTVVFSTSATFPAGRISGTIEARGLSASGVALWCYQEGRAPDSTARDFDALGLADAQGVFRVDGLAVPARYRLWVFADQNGNRSFEPTTDILAPIDTTFALTAERPVAEGVLVTVINPRAPGTLFGAVLDSLPDSVGVVRVLATSESDSTKRVLADADAEGAFELKLDPGAWIVRAFRDLDRNRLWQPESEPASEPRRIEVEAASEVREFRLRIDRRGRP